MKAIFSNYALVLIMLLSTFTSCSISSQTKNSLQHSNIDSENEMIVNKNLAIFDKLENIIFKNKDWTRLNEGYSKNVIVNWPNGYKTTGIDKHVEDLKKMFDFAPDTKIKQHTIHFGSGNMTCVAGVLTGTFTSPMSIGNGKFISPTGKMFSIPVCSVGIWKDGVMTTEYLYWDNEACLNQIGLIE